MSDEENAKQIVRLTLVPVGAIIETSDRWNRCSLVGIGLYANARVVVDGEQVINDLKTMAPCRVVNTGDIGNLGELSSCMVFEKCEDRDDGWRCDIDC